MKIQFIFIKILSSTCLALQPHCLQATEEQCGDFGNLMSHFQSVYDLPHRVEVLKYMYAVKDWLSSTVDHMPSNLSFAPMERPACGIVTVPQREIGREMTRGSPFIFLKDYPP